MTREQIYIQGNLLWFLSLILALVLQVLVGHWLWLTCNAAVENVPPRPLISLNLANAVIVPEPKPSTESNPEVLVPNEAEPEIAPEPIVTSEPESEPVVEKIVARAEPVIEEKPQEIKKPVVKKTLPRPRVVKKPVTKPETKPTIKKVQAEVIADKKKNDLPRGVSKRTQNIDKKPVVAALNQGNPAKANATDSSVRKAQPAPVDMNRFSAYLRSVFRAIERSRRYPANARRRRIQGSVEVSFRILAGGKAADIKASDTSPEILREAALKLLQTVRVPAPPKSWDSGSRISMTIRYALR